ncbi:uncharacterized protein SCHCODRAFT_02501945 [Schizophyllum commune H4-8]|uniref:Expressed protein n=1 Tax=Schizophyllum commune (strain H4-8 / FGSC 9210) TaxID=578458 RepID=D8Q4A1_SCHCM|nr:uncharacterized protein SCHCODRAFT_02501945 [Schizophyllum commune H4-8]KAI5892705.1 hypothetical protein SCHCODRAFT_02501945 [Schizophyllum commune H4-8]
MLGSLLPGALSTTPPRPTRSFWSSDLVDRARIYAGRMKEGHSNRAHRLRTMTIALQSFSSLPRSLARRPPCDRLECAPPRSVSCRRDSTGNGASRTIEGLKGAYFLFFSTPHSTVRDLIRHKVRDQNQRLRTDLR